MPWRCPGCGTPIQHNPDEARPRFGVRYRCYLCRLELVMDPAIKLVEPADEAILTNQTPSDQT
jgi:hypothetical protein